MLVPVCVVFIAILFACRLGQNSPPVVPMSAIFKPTLIEEDRLTPNQRRAKGLKVEEYENLEREPLK